DRACSATKAQIDARSSGASSTNVRNRSERPRSSWSRRGWLGTAAKGTSATRSSPSALRYQLTTVSDDKSAERNPLDGVCHGEFFNLPRRIYLTYKYHG